MSHCICAFIKRFSQHKALRSARNPEKKEIFKFRRGDIDATEMDIRAHERGSRFYMEGPYAGKNDLDLAIHDILRAYQIGSLK